MIERINYPSKLVPILKRKQQIENQVKQQNNYDIFIKEKDDESEINSSNKRPNRYRKYPVEMWKEEVFI